MAILLMLAVALVDAAGRSAIYLYFNYQVLFLCSFWSCYVFQVDTILANQACWARGTKGDTKDHQCHTSPMSVPALCAHFTSAAGDVVVNKYFLLTLVCLTSILTGPLLAHPLFYEKGTHKRKKTPTTPGPRLFLAMELRIDGQKVRCRPWECWSVFHSISHLICR
jgi:hypothetical protein